MKVTGTLEEASDPVLQSKTVSPSTSQQTVTPDSGYDGLSQVTVNAMPTATLATPSISVNANGTITASLYQNNSGYVTAGSSKTKTATLSSAYDSDFIASNIKKGVTIFGLAGTYEGTSSGGGGLPSGISALASGTYTPTENKTSRVDVSHGLGVTPNFLVVMMEEDTSSTPLTSALVGATVFFKSMKYNSSSSIQYTAHITMEGYASSAQATGSATRAASNAYFTTTTVGIPCNSTYVLKSGYTYRWVCGVLDGIN